MNNYEPAFPTGTGVTPYKSGMTLRDYFAAKAMEAMIMHPDSSVDVGPSVFAKGAYRMADAMLKEREAK